MTSQFFSVFDIASALFVFMLVTLHALWKRNRHANDPHYRYFLPGVFFRFPLAIFFGIFYILSYVGGGDTVAYWDGAVKLNNLFWDSPVNYLAELFGDTQTGMTAHFNKSTGLPPSWIYAEPESWLVCKIYSVFIIFGFKGYLALTILFSYLSSLATWKFFELARGFALQKEGWTAFAVLFIPSVAFWCSGISKDTLLYISLLLFICYLFRVIGPKTAWHPGTWIGLLVFGWALWNIRSVMFVAALLPLIFALNARLMRRYVHSIALRIVALGFFTGLAVFGTLFVLSNGAIASSETIAGMAQEAIVVQKDFTNNVFYGQMRYDLGVTDYSLLGMLKAMPMSILAGLYRPFPWEALNASLLMNGIESALFLWLTARFFVRRRLRARLRQIRKNEFLIYLLVLMLFIAFFSGFTSVLFGVLVRIRVFALPFLALLLCTEPEPESDADPATVPTNDEIR